MAKFAQRLHVGRHPTYIRNTTALLRSSCVCTAAFLSSSAGLAATGFVLRLVASVACCWFLAACKARALHLGSGSTWLEQHSTVGTQLYSAQWPPIFARDGCSRLVYNYIARRALSGAICRYGLLAAPSLLDFEARFLQLLRKTYITQPSEEVLEAITSRLPAHMIACSTPERAAKLYAEAKLLPGASTAAHLFTQHKLRVNGPLYLRYLHNQCVGTLCGLAILGNLLTGLQE